MKERYQQEIVPALMKEFGYSNVMQAPRFTKISVNIGLGEALTEQPRDRGGDRRYGDGDGPATGGDQGAQVDRDL